MAYGFLKTWRWAAGSLLVVILYFLFADPSLAGGLCLSILNGEGSVAYWTKDAALTFWEAIGIAITCSSFDIFTWFCLGGVTKKFYVLEVQPLYKEIDRKADLKTMNGRAEWAKNIYRFCRPVYDFFVPKSPFADKEESFRPTPRYYLPLLLYGSIPGDVFTGVGYSYSFRLNLGIAGFVLAAGNAAKMIVFGRLAMYCAVKLPLWGVIALMIVGPLMIKFLIINPLLKMRRND